MSNGGGGVHPALGCFGLLAVIGLVLSISSGSHKRSFEKTWNGIDYYLVLYFDKETSVEDVFNFRNAFSYYESKRPIHVKLLVDPEQINNNKEYVEVFNKSGNAVSSCVLVDVSPNISFRKPDGYLHYIHAISRLERREKTTYSLTPYVHCEYVFICSVAAWD